MDAATRDRLLELNRAFYATGAAEFSATRRRPWRGWERVLQRLAAGRRSILDLGCGNGRLADACARRFPPGSWSYLGVDTSDELLEEAGRRLERLRPARYRLLRADLLAADAPFWASEPHDLVALFGVLHHVPGGATRRDLLRRAAAAVAPGGLLAVSFWQWAASPRLAARTVPPGLAGLRAADLEPGDHLLRWGDGAALRYCHACPPDEAAASVAELGLRPVDVFAADGAGGAMNHYRVLARA